MKTKLLSSLLLVLAWVFYGCNTVAHAQSPNPPDCVIPFQVNVTGSGTISFGGIGGVGFDNRTIGCQTYTIFYSLTGSGTFTSIDFQSATGALHPGTFHTWTTGGGVVATGINPNTDGTTGTSTFTTGCVSMSGCTVVNSWLRVLFTPGTFTGTVSGILYGYKTGNGGGGGGGGGGSGCPGTVATPCVTAGVESAATAQSNTFCDKTADFTISAGTDVVVVAGSGGIVTRICGLSALWDNTANVTIEQGSGTTCLSSTAALAGPYQNSLGFAFDYGPSGPQHTSATGLDICLHFSTSVTGGGGVLYAQ